MAKPAKNVFSIKPAPTFKAPVNIHVPGAAEPGVINLEFKHIKPKDLEARMESLQGKTDVEVIQELAVGWDVDGEFDADNIGELVDNYANVGVAVINGLAAALIPASRGN